MGKFNPKRKQVLSLLTALFIFAIVLPGCKKKIDQTTDSGNVASSVVTIDQIKQWSSSFIPKLTDQPQLAFELAQKTTNNGRSYVRVPTFRAGSEGGFFYFTKTPDGELQSLYVLTDQKDKTKPDGIVGFADFENKTFTLATYQNNKPVALYSVKDTKQLFANVFMDGITGTSAVRKQINGCTEATKIIKLPNGNDQVVLIKINGGPNIGCPSDKKTFWQKLVTFFSDIWGGITSAFNFLFGWIGSGGSTGVYAAGGAFGSGGYSGWGFGGFAGGGYSTGFGGGGYSDPGTGGTGPYDPFRGAWEPYDPITDQANVDAYALSLGYYWEKPDYDVNSYTFPQYNPAVDGPYDNQGYRKNGPFYQYAGGTVQNYTNDNGGKYAVFTSSNGVTTLFPGATITDFGVLDRAGVTTANGGIHMSTNQNKLEDLQHEYGHYLHAQAIGSVEYYRTIVPASLYSAATNSHGHRFFWTETIANNLAASFFGPNSAIAKSTYYPK